VIASAPSARTVSLADATPQPVVTEHVALRRQYTTSRSASRDLIELRSTQLAIVVRVDDAFLTIAEVAELLKLNQQTIPNWV